MLENGAKVTFFTGGEDGEALRFKPGVHAGEAKLLVVHELGNASTGAELEPSEVFAAAAAAERL